MRHALPILFVLSATPVFAQTIDVSGADALKNNFERYLGSTAFDQGIVAITPSGDAYELEIQFDKLLSLFPGQDMVKLDVEPYVLRLKPREDETWDVSGGLGPDGKIEIKAENGTQTSEWTIADDSFSGVYDPALASFSAATGKNGALSMTSRDPASSSEFTAAAGTFQMQSTKNATQGIDFSALQTLTETVQTMTFQAKELGTDVPVVIRSPEMSYTSGATGLQAQPLLDLLAFAVANAEEDKIKAEQEQLKTLLRAALPLWEQMTGAYGWRELSVGTPFGIFSSSNAKIEVAMDGVRKDATISYGMQLEDLKVPDGVAPAWSVKLLPEDIDLNIGGVGIDLEAPTAAAIDALDLNNDPPIAKEVSDQIVARFLAAPPKLVLNRSVISNKDTEISAEGEMTFIDAKPAMTATIEATGFDAAVQSVQQASATAPEAQQVVMVALAAKGFAKALPDGRLQWVVNMTADGAVTVNGTMVKPADSPAAPAPQ